MPTRKDYRATVVRLREAVKIACMIIDEQNVTAATLRAWDAARDAALRTPTVQRSGVEMLEKSLQKGVG